LNRKLIALDILLVAAVVYVGIDLRNEYLAAKARQAKLLHTGVATASAPPFQKSPETAPVMATAYANIAQKLLLDPSRNPDIPIPEVPKPPPPPPPPPLPVYHGMMNIGGGPQIILSVKAEGARQWLSPGDKIGDYTLLAFNSEAVELEWNGQHFIKALTEIAGHGAGQQEGNSGANQGLSMPATAPPPVPQSLGPGGVTPNGDRACQNADSDAIGTVRDGFVKTEIHNALLGTTACIWKPVGK